MRFVAVRLSNIKAKEEEDDASEEETWKPSVEGFVKYLVDSQFVFDTIEHFVDQSDDVSYAYFRNTGLERAGGVSKDLEWFSGQGVVIPEPSTPGVSYAPLFLSHFYNIYFSHIAGGQVIGKQRRQRRQGSEAEYIKRIVDTISSEYTDSDEEPDSEKEDTDEEPDSEKEDTDEEPDSKVENNDEEPDSKRGRCFRSI
ncbi:hypothetical protein Dsin_010959 [Dipteronia sinensis]|uniref:Uncharacterized protein n=1 Tax=Dipteronia sinensis TaxID=43782 RepID=A0AAE0AUT2_9ROSI|nr:hypothetical protein Dsin_010959 [Dipteronia sinensis]